MAGYDGLRVLVVEDEDLVALMVEDMVADLGCEVVHTARTVPEALAAAETERVEFALLDVNLSGSQVFPVADALIRRQIPFAFASGYGQGAVPDTYRTVPVIPKPFRIEDIDAAIRSVVPAAD
jgi:CheY-like chemotaxis protein